MSINSEWTPERVARHCNRWVPLRPGLTWVPCHHTSFNGTFPAAQSSGKGKRITVWVEFAGPEDKSGFWRAAYTTDDGQTRDVGCGTCVIKAVNMLTTEYHQEWPAPYYLDPPERTNVSGSEG